MSNWATRLWDTVSEGTARIVEKKKLGDDARIEWTASVIAIREKYYPTGLFRTVYPSTGGIRFGPAEQTTPAGALKAPRWIRQVKGDGPLYLAWEAQQLGLITKKQLDRETWDTVYWIAGYKTVNGKKIPQLTRIARDFGQFKDSVRAQLDAMGLQRPRTDELERWLGLSVAVAATAAAIAVTIIIPASAPATVPYILGVGGAVSTGLFNQAAKDDSDFKAAADAAGVTNVTTEDDALFRGAAGASLGVGSMYGQPDATAKDYIDAAIRGYTAATTPPAPVTTTVPAPSSSSSMGEWIKSPTGMVITGGAIVLVLVLALRK